MLSIMSLPYPKGYKGNITKDYELPEDLFLEQWIIPKGSVVKLQQTQNFGWVFIPLHTKDKRGFEIPKHIFKY